MCFLQGEVKKAPPCFGVLDESIIKGGWGEVRGTRRETAAHTEGGISGVVGATGLVGYGDDPLTEGQAAGLLERRTRV